MSTTDTQVFMQNAENSRKTSKPPRFSAMQQVNLHKTKNSLEFSYDKSTKGYGMFNRQATLLCVIARNANVILHALLRQ